MTDTIREAAQAPSDAAARMLAECMDYPWDHMPEEGRESMRKHAAKIIAAALAEPAPQAVELPDWIPGGAKHIQCVMCGFEGALLSQTKVAPVEPQPVESQCTYCDGTGDVHSIDGEWRGVCTCEAGQKRCRILLDECARHNRSEAMNELIEECRAALAEELSAWDIDPPIHHIKQAHDKCVAWLAPERHDMRMERVDAPNALDWGAVDAAPVALTDDQIEDIRQDPKHHKGEYIDYVFDALSFARAVLSAAAPQAVPAPAEAQDDAGKFYVQDTRQYVGNDVMWWAHTGNGYTTDLRKAHVYTEAEAARLTHNRGTDRAWPKAEIDAIARPAVDMQYLPRRAAIAKQPK